LLKNTTEERILVQSTVENGVDGGLSALVSESIEEVEAFPSESGSDSDSTDDHDGLRKLLEPMVQVNLPEEEELELLGAGSSSHVVDSGEPKPSTKDEYR